MTPTLRATRSLIDLLEGRTAGSGWLARAHQRTIERLGGPADAEAMLPVLLAEPARGESLVGPLMHAGDATIARRLFEACCDERALRPGMPAGLLHLFGFHGLVEALPILWRYARGDAEVAGSYGELIGTNRPAVYGLLHLPCDPIRDEIEREVRACVGHAFFPPFLPALAVRADRPALLDTLDEIRRVTRVEDDGGIVLGTALFGEAGRRRFEDDLLWTGTDTEVFDGMCVLGISVAEVFDAWRARVAGGVDPVSGIYLLQALLWLRLGGGHTGLRFAPFPRDTVQEVFARVFDPPAEGDRAPITTLVRRHLGTAPDARDLVTQFDVLEQAYLGRVEEEVLLAEQGRGWES